MALKKRNGHDPGTERIVEVLERMEKGLTGLHNDVTGLRNDLTGLRNEVRTTNTRLDALREELHEFRVETREELLDLHAAQHQLRMELKGSIEPRLDKLEAAVFPATGT